MTEPIKYLLTHYRVVVVITRISLVRVIVPIRLVVRERNGCSGFGGAYGW